MGGELIFEESRIIFVCKRKWKSGLQILCWCDMRGLWGLHMQIKKKKKAFHYLLQEKQEEHFLID